MVTMGCSETNNENGIPPNFINLLAPKIEQHLLKYHIYKLSQI